MASPRIPALTANLMLDAGIGSLANSGKLRIYNGAQPLSGGGTIGAQQLLAEFNMAADAFPGAAGGVLTASAITAAVGLLAGNATWYRLTKSDGTTVLIDGSVGLEADNPDVIIDDVAIDVGEPVAVTSFKITMPLA
jgi:hypothetical protein